MPDTTNQEQTINAAVGDIRVLRAREDALYLNNNNATRQHWNSHWRELICEWMYHVVDHFDMPRDIVAVAMDLLDRAIVLQGEVSKGRFQCLSMTCFFLALKIRKQRILSLEDLVILGRGRLLKEEILDAEIGIIVALQGRLEAPAGRDFLALYEKYWRGRNATFVVRFLQDSIIPAAEYLVELSILDAYFEVKRPSIVALAAAQVAMEEEQQMNQGRPWGGLPAYTMVTLPVPPFTGTSDAQELNDIKRRLRALKVNGEMSRASRL